MGQVTHNRKFYKAGPTNSGGLRKHSGTGTVTVLPYANSYWVGWKNRGGFTPFEETRMYLRYDLSTVPDVVTNMDNFKITWRVRMFAGTAVNWQLTFGTKTPSWMTQTLNSGDWGIATTFSAFVYPGGSTPSAGTFTHTLPSWWGFFFTRTGYQDFELRDTSAMNPTDNPTQWLNWTGSLPELSFDVTYRHPGVGHKVMWTP